MMASSAGRPPLQATQPPRVAPLPVSAILPEKLDIAQRTRYMEIVGFSASLLALIISLFIFKRFESLRNTRTNIHCNLFFAMTIQVVIRLIVYIDQAVIRDQPEYEVSGLDGMPYICEVCYILLEYAISAMFMWMFIEGLFLHKVATGNVMRQTRYTGVYLVVGWGLPVLLTSVWAVVTALYYDNDDVQRCWYGYNFLPQYWLVQAPRLAVILINLGFLLNIMRVLITKLNATENNEMTKIQKAVKAALVLLPLLGITNVLNMIEPVSGSVWKFALWCYVTHFLRSFQGFFIALLYCFLNGEVNDVIAKTYRDRIEERRVAERSDRNETDRQQNNWCAACLRFCCIRPVLSLYAWLDKKFPPPDVLNEDVGLQVAIQASTANARRRRYTDPEDLSDMDVIRPEDTATESV